MNRVVNIYINFNSFNPQKYVFKQLDSTELHCVFNDVDISDKRISLVWKKPNNNIVRIDAEIQNNIALFLLPIDCVRNYGNIEIEIELIDGEQLISTFRMSGIVEKSNKDNIESDNSPNYLEKVEKGLKQTQEMLDSIGGKLAEIDEVKEKTESLEKDKADKTELPKKTSELENDSNFPADENYVHTDNNFTDTDKNKLDGLENYDDTGIKEEIEEAKSIAKGRATGYVFNTKSDMDIWLENEDNRAKLVQGDNLYIKALDVPDYWWDGTQVQELETQKVDLINYVQNTDYATAGKAGVIKTTSDFGISTAGSGELFCGSYSNEVYNQKHQSTFISKGTLENVIVGKELVNKTYVDNIVGDIETALDIILGKEY